MAKRVLLTGIGGFIGAHCLDHWMKETDWEIVGIDSFRHKGSVRRLEEVWEKEMRWAVTYKEEWARRVKVYSHDLAVPFDHQLENLIMDRKINDRGQITERKIDYIVNMASDSAVERSASDPVACLRNNYDLTINMLEFARKIKPTVFYQVSTDEVYGEAKPGQAHKEWDVIMPSNPYAASKAAQEAVAISYWRTYGVPVVITNTMNNIGEWQDHEKFLPKIIQFVATGQEMPIYADSENSIGTRFYLHAKNHADAFMFLANQPVASYDRGDERPDRYNVCGDVELNNLELAKMVAQILDKPLKYKLVHPATARKGYDRRYALDGSKMKKLGWKPPLTFKESIERIVKWTMDNPHWLV